MSHLAQYVLKKVEFCSNFNLVYGHTTDYKDFGIKNRKKNDTNFCDRRHIRQRIQLHNG